MRKSNYDNINGELLKLDQCSQLCNLSIAAVRRAAEEAGAVIRIGRSIRIDREKLMNHLKSLHA